ncbi:hypothetical protein [Microcoleus sp. N3A4]|uniref:hypothetical protein n=1 Tax=Microcoleus sp. N3A4 TaxID=3055379 RepID=UPI002FCFD6C7
MVQQTKCSKSLLNNDFEHRMKQCEHTRYGKPEILQHIMQSSGTRQADLVGIIGSSAVVSEVVNGKRAISKAQAKALGDYFKISPSLFI